MLKRSMIMIVVEEPGKQTEKETLIFTKRTFLRWKWTSIGALLVRGPGSKDLTSAAEVGKLRSSIDRGECLNLKLSGRTKAVLLTGLRQRLSIAVRILSGESVPRDYETNGTDRVSNRKLVERRLRIVLERCQVLIRNIFKNKIGPISQTTRQKIVTRCQTMNVFRRCIKDVLERISFSGGIQTLSIDQYSKANTTMGL